MEDIHQLPKLRSLGKLEQVAAACHHLGFYNNVGVSAQYNSEIVVSDLQQAIYHALDIVIQQYPILSAIPVDEDGVNPYFAILPSIDLSKVVFFKQRSTNSSDSAELDAILQDQHNTSFKADYGSLPFWRVIILEELDKTNKFTACFIFHHAIGDGMSGVIFHSAFRDAMHNASIRTVASPTVTSTPKQDLMPCLEDLHPLPINPDPPQAKAPKGNQWTGNAISEPCTTRYKTLYISPASSVAFIAECKTRNISVTSGLTSVISSRLFNILPESTDALTCIVPINLRPWLSLPQTTSKHIMGSYIDAIQVQINRNGSDTGDEEGQNIWRRGSLISGDIKQHLEQKTPAGIPYTAVGVFKSIPDVSLVFKSTIGNPRDTALEVSNLGTFTNSSPSSSSSWQIGQMTFSRSSVVSGSAVTTSIITGGDGGISIGFSWQQGIVDDSLIDRLVEETKNYFTTHTIPYSQAAIQDPRITISRPAIDSTLAPIVDAFPLPEELDIQFMRSVGSDIQDEAFIYNADNIIKQVPHLLHLEKTVSSTLGHDDIILSIFSPKEPKSTSLPALYHIHGGGMVSGDRFSAITQLIDLLDDIECVIVSVEYRLAPETKAPGAAGDCYEGLVWISENAANLGIDAANIVVFGTSGGGCLAAATCLMARDRKRPLIPIKAQFLSSPMLDDRCDSISDQQFEYGIPWCGVTNRQAWDQVLGGSGDRGSDKITAYQAPSRATDLSNLPSTYIDTAECEVFRDPAVQYAQKLWRDGSTCELHVWPGAFHLFDGMDNPDIPLIHDAFVCKRKWLKRIMIPRQNI